MRPRSSVSIALLVAGLVIGMPGVSRGAPKGSKKNAQAHIERATRAHSAGKFKEALVELQAAYKIDPQPDLLYAIGQVYVQLDKCPDAIPYYERFLATNPDKDAASEVNGAIAACKTKLSATSAATTEPATTEPATTEPATAEPAKTEPAKTEPTKTEPTKTEPPKSPLPEPEQPSPPVTSQPSHWYNDRLDAGLVIGGLAVTLIGVLEYRSALSDLDDADTATSLASYTDLVDSAHTKRTFSVVFVGGGLGLVGVGVARYMLHRGHPTEARGVAVAPANHGGLITWTGRF